jgi:hypothetical protein
MNDADLDRLRELSWRRKLTSDEVADLQKRLAADPRARAEWQTEAALNQILECLPDAPPVASNFTALVMRSVARDAAAQSRERIPSRRAAWRGWRWLPRVGVAGLVAGFVFLGYERHQAQQRAALARSMAEVAEVVSASGPDFMQDMEPIRRLGNTQPQPDLEILALMSTK